MLTFLLQKLKQKKWMVLSLLVGNILLIAITVSHPLYKQAALDRMLADEFTTYLSENGNNPGIYSCSTTRTKSNIDAFDELREKMLSDNDLFGIPIVTSVEYLHEPSTSATYEVKRDQKSEVTLQLSYLSDLENHARIISGKFFSDGLEDGSYEGIVSETAFVKLNLIVGDELTLNTVKDENGNLVKVKIVGVFTCEDNTDVYWVDGPSSYDTDIFISYNQFSKLHMEGDRINTIVLGKWFKVFDTDNMLASQVNGLIDKTEDLGEYVKEKGGRVVSCDYLKVLDSFSEKNNSVVNSLLILQVPVMVLLCAFLFMISGQMLSMEQNEISLLKSRGAARRQIFGLYFWQSTLLAFVSLIFAIPLGMLLCRLLGSANAFLAFEGRRALKITLGKETWLYAIGAVFVSIVVQVIPAVKRSKLTIVSAKQKKHNSNKPWWQKMFLDVIMLGVALYGFYSFNSRKSELALQVLEGDSMDPLLYFSSSLFILGAGLVLLRFWPYLVKLVFAIGKKRWKPEKYASFLQIIRTGHKQLFMMEFLILTVALGIFNATVARTILFNAEENEIYEIGCDLVIDRQWKSNYNQYIYGQASELIYTEPDSTAFENLAGVKSMTKVFSGQALKGTSVTNSSGRYNSSSYAKLYYMGIVTNEFGPMVVDNGGNPYSLQEYLNVLSTNPKAVLVSENYKNKQGLKLGDTVRFTYVDSQAESWTREFEGVIYGFFKEFPTYSATTTSIAADGSAVTTDNYLIVGNLNGMQSQMGDLPYSLWFDLEDNGEENIFEYVNENKISVKSYNSLDESLEKIYYDPLFQGTNGILTLSFIVILILCGVGFLIYWVLSIRERELLFGVFRAMGMSKQSILAMLINEQMFSSLVSLLAGTGIGFLASALFVPMIQMTYTAGNQVLVTPLVTWPSDMIKLFAVILLVFSVCMYVLAKIIFTMKITNALKLGED